MGLSIHYSGALKSEALLEALIEEVKDIAEIYNWPYQVFDTAFPKNSFSDCVHNDEMYGISFTPPNCETISLTFLSNGKLCSAVNLMLYDKDDTKDKATFLYTISSKTQYSGSAIHKVLIHFLKHLSETYFQEFTLIDEGNYWETGDESILENQFKIYNDLLDSITNSLETQPLLKGESFEAYFERILKMIHDRRSGNL